MLSPRQWLVLLAVLFCPLVCPADELWNLLQQARPGLARQRIQRPTLLQQAMIAQAEGDTGEAWRLVRQLEKDYPPGGQPAEFFWVRGLLLRNDQWDLSSKNLAGILQTPCNRELRVGALSLLAQGAAEQHIEGESQQYWNEATAQASLLAPEQIAPLLRFSLIQANLQLLHNQPSQALATLLAARALAEKAGLPALAALVELKIAEVEIELADWQAFPNTCLRALERARSCAEPWLVEKICSFWVEQQLARRSEPRALSQCVNALAMAEGWFSGRAQLAVMRSLARAYTVGLNQRSTGLALLERALQKCPVGKLRVRILAERLSQIPTTQKEDRRAAVERLIAGLARLGPLEAEDQVMRALPRYGCWAALAETYLPEQPDVADRYFQKAQATAPTTAARLEVVNFQLTRYNAVGALPLARKSLAQLLAMVRAAPLDQETTRILRSQMFGLRNEARQLTRLLINDEIGPAPESPSLIVLSELLQEEALQAKMEREIYDRIRLAQNYRESVDAYLARAELLLTQSRWAETLLALERMQQSAKQGGWPLRQAAALRMMAETYWTMGRGNKALECIAAAQSLYAASANSRDQRAASDCQVVQAYFLLRSLHPTEALAMCQQNKGPWFTFLSGRCLLALGRKAEAEVAFAGCAFEEGLAEVGRLLYWARCSPRADTLYELAYNRARQLSSLKLRDVCLEWAEWLRQHDQPQRALQLEADAITRVTALLNEYPPQVRERLLDQPSTQKLFKSSRPNAPALGAPRESRRTFLARLNEIRQRYPGLDSALAVSPGDLIALQETLPQNRVLLEYFSADTDLYALRIDSQGCRVLQVAVEKAVLQDWAEQVRQALSQGGELPAGPAHQLYLSLVESLGPGLEGKQVQVIPNGFFWYLPWDVLLDSQGRYLVETQEWSCVSPTQLLRSGFRHLPAALELNCAVTVGGTSLDLPATAQEAQGVASLFPHGIALLGPQARISELVRLAPQAQVLHLAAHSGLSADLNQTYIELGDGHFTLEQVYGMQLQRGSTVVLSSCESALGQPAPGREVSSLAGAFLASGAATVVATLWRVEDDSSAAFFGRFYPLLLQHRSISSALREARLQCLADPKLCQPSSWGAYQLIGDPG